MFFSKTEKQESQALACPGCSTKLDIFTWKGVEVDRCPRCYGIWFDYGEMKAIQESDSLENIDDAFPGVYQERPVEDSMEDPERHCPRDGSLLNRYEWYDDSSIVMDGCPLCKGIYLDAGELEGYVAYLKDLEENPGVMTEEMRKDLQRKHAERIREVSQWADQAMDWGPFDRFINTMLGIGSHR